MTLKTPSFVSNEDDTVRTLPVGRSNGLLSNRAAISPFNRMVVMSSSNESGSNST